ncbi:MAG: beta-lactamase family protein [Acidimicrobiia bacterium]|nr:beta-lactamase family protein [Acidimicrobiia bacterium]
MSQSRRALRAAVFISAVALVASACGGASGSESDPTTTVGPTTTAAPSTTVAPTTTTVVEEGLAAVAPDLEAELTSWIAEYEVGGAVLAVSAPGEDTLVIPVGVSNKAEGTPISGDDYFRIGSVTKMTTVTMLLQLQEEGLLDLDTPLVELLPSWADRDFGEGAAITPRMLLNHTTGMIAYELDSDFSSLTLGRLTQEWQPDEIIDFALGKGLLFEPGTEWSYGTTTYLLAGQLVEELTGNTADQELAARVLNPLGMTETYLPPAQQPPKPVVSGYYDLAGTGEETAVVTALPQAALQSAGWTGGGLESQVTDLIKLLPGIVDGGLLTAESLAEMSTPALDTDYGLGVNVAPIAGYDAWWHGGGVPGFRTAHAYFPDSGVSIGLVSNSTGPDVWGYIERAAKLILG